MSPRTHPDPAPSLRERVLRPWRSIEPAVFVPASVIIVGLIAFAVIYSASAADAPRGTAGGGDSGAGAQANTTQTRAKRGVWSSLRAPIAKRVARAPPGRFTPRTTRG